MGFFAMNESAMNVHEALLCSRQLVDVVPIQGAARRAPARRW